MLSCEFGVPSSSDDYIGVPDGSREKISLVDSIRRCVWELLIKKFYRLESKRGIENLTLHLF